MKPTTSLWFATFVAACANIAPPTPAEAERLAEARRLVEAHPDAALEITDSLLTVNPDLREARRLAGEGSLRLCQQGTSTRRDLLLQDAVNNFERGLEGVDENEQPAAFRMLAECQYELGEYEQGSKAATRAAAGFAATKAPADQRRAAEAMLIAARCDYRRFAALRKEEIDSGTPDHRGIVPAGRATAELASLAASRFDMVRTHYSAEATTQLTAIHQWLGQDGAVAQEFERGLRTSPQESAIHDAYIAWMTSAGQHDAMVGAYSRMVRESPDIPLLRWHQGRAVYSRADKQRGEGNFQGALATYGKASGIFAEYGALMPVHADSTNQWLALCEMSIARTAVEMGDVKSAESHLFAAAERSPAATDYTDGKPQLVDSFGSHFAGAVFAIHRTLAESGEEALPKTLAFNEAVLQRYPDRWGFVYNNAALAARDLGVQKSKQGDAAVAKELWERSYRYYEKAVELSPDDARIVNDCGLMLIYHLDRDFDRARALFERAIAVGQPQLDALPTDTEPRERELLEEAIGDAYQNIAVLMREHLGQPFEAYRSFCEQAVRYYPYQRREAAGLLRRQGQSEVSSQSRSSAVAAPAAVQGGAAAAVQVTAPAMQGGAAEALAKQAAAIKAKVDAADFDGALTVLDGIAKECREHAPFHVARGEITLKLAAQARDAGRRGVDLFYQDAVSALKRAVELDSEPVAPRLMLAEAQYQTNDSEASTKTLTGLLLHMQSQGGGKPADLLAVHTLRANSAARAYSAKKAQGNDDKELLTATRASYRLLEEKDQLDAPLRLLWSSTEQWAGAPAEAVNIFVRALSKHPDDQSLLALVLETAEALSQVPLAIEALQTRSDATSLWYLGKAHYLQAAAVRDPKKPEPALAALDTARRTFASSMQKNADYRDSCEQWIAMCLGKKGNIAFWSDDLNNAEAWLLESVRLRPDRIGEDLGLLETTRAGIVNVGDKYFRQENLGKVEAIYRAASDAANGDLLLLNNSGLFARDYGNQLERDGKKQEAMAMYEQSYKAYTRAQLLDPQNVRLRNDRALIAIYHLERDWDLSKQMLDSAIADGEKTRRDTPPGEANEREQLEEAIGDCYENLALWHLKHSKDGAAAKAAAEASQKYFPGARRNGARRHLQAAERLLQGK